MIYQKNAGYLEADFQAGDSITDYIYQEIKKRHPGWNANVLHSLEMKADNDFYFIMDGWDWHTVDGYWFGSNCIIRSITVNADVTGLKMSFRYDD